ncbi:MAG: hypothetical protein AAFO29_17335, partial [Actinomycetota bacterium]
MNADAAVPLTNPNVATPDGVSATIDIDQPTLGRLRTMNLAAGALHLVSAVVMTIIAADFTLPITSFN